MTLSERLRESTRDVVTGEKLFAGAFGHAPIEYLDEAADELDRLTARVQELETVLSIVRDILTDERWGTWRYMEGSDVYDDLRDAISAIDAARRTE